MLRRRKKNYLESLSRAVNPATTVIAFDLHNVVFKKQTPKIVIQSLKLLPKGTWRYTFNPRLWYRFYKIKKTSTVAEDIFQKMSDQYPGLQRFREDFIKLTNHQRPVRSVMELIQSLKQQGYSLYILSNIGKETFGGLCELYPELNDYFDGAFTALSENNYMQKPYHEFYRGFQTFVCQEGHADKQILFVDDLKKNLIAAAQCNIAGVHFTSPKNLLRTFKKLEILT